MKLSMLLLQMCYRKQTEYKLNFVILCIAVTPIHILQMFFSWIIVKSFGSFNKWDSWNLIFLYGLLLISYSIAQVFFRKFRYLDEYVIDGTLDIYFLKPQPIIYNLVFYNITTMELFSQLLPSFLVLILACWKNEIEWSLVKYLVLICAVLGGAIIQICIFLLIGSISFWTTKSSDLENLFFSFKEFMNYPIDVYGKNIVFFLTCILPLAFVNYYPALYILGKGNCKSFINFLTLPVSIGLGFLMSIIWRLAIRRYSSAGS